MSIGLFVDKGSQPTESQVRAAIGDRLLFWEELVRHIRVQYPAEEDFKFLYGKKYGWALRFRIRGQLLTSLYPTNGGFTVQINLDPEAIEVAQSLMLGENVQRAIARAHPYPEGRWLFISVESENDLWDTQRLLALRVQTKRLR